MPVEGLLPEHNAELTAYDRAHLAHYIRLLDAATEQADWKEAVQIIFGIDPRSDATAAQRVYDENLKRARWMTQTGYAHLVSSKPDR